MNCEGCAYNKERECAVFLERMKNCWNHTTEKEAQKREEAIKKYEKQRPTLRDFTQLYTI